jgi:hypothetical protein
MYIGTCFKKGILFMTVQIVFIPFVSRQRFAELVGVSSDVLERWIRDGRVPCVAMGKYSLVDLRVWLGSGDNAQEGKTAPITALLGRAQSSLSRDATTPRVTRG